ncbi:MAG: ATP-binding cassette domain-containing protein [Candidatus Izimaplasma sp.]|nr:ATP-binding cassette domain-containing protein [Candidatus Izimaplasma bacterium]
MNDPLIDISNLSVKYGNISALKKLNFSIDKGDYIGIIGPNGGGKTTLIKSILGLIKPNSGEIKYCGTSLKKSNIKMGYVPQINDINRMFPISVKEVVLSGRLTKQIKPFFRFQDEDELLALDVLKTVGIYELRDRLISELSGGEFQKLLIARALTLDPDILLLDEPTAMIDVMSQRQIFNLIKKLSGKMTIILITHHIQMITKHVKKLIYLDKNILAEGDPNEVYKYAYIRPIHQSISNKYREVRNNV